MLRFSWATRWNVSRRPTWVPFGGCRFEVEARGGSKDSKLKAGRGKVLCRGLYRGARLPSADGKYSPRVARDSGFSIDLG